jgi:phage-related protein
MDGGSWVGSTRKDLKEFPDEVTRAMGHALNLAQIGDKSPDAKPLKGFGGAGVLEIVEDWDGDTYRAVYTVKLSSGVYVLHAFQKKSHRGKETDKHDLDLIRRRLVEARRDDQERSAASAATRSTR